MKKLKAKHLRAGALLVVGVFLGRGAHAGTVLDFNNIPPDQTENSIINQGFGSFAATSSEGVTVNGFGTPNIGIVWATTGASDTEWDYYYDGGSVWTAVQLNDSDLGDAHSITFAPNNPGASVVLDSFNFDPYYQSSERFTYNVSILSGTNVLQGPAKYTFLSDGAADHPVTLNYTGAPGQALQLRLDRIASTLGAGEIEGGAYNIAIDDISFAQTPQTLLQSGPQVATNFPANGQTTAAIYYPYFAGITNGDTALVASSIQLKLDGVPVAPAPSISSSPDGTTNVSYLGTNLIASGTHVYTLTYQDNGGATYTNNVIFSSPYVTLPASYALPLDAGLAPGFTFRTVSASAQVSQAANPDQLDSTIARAIAQLNGTLIDTNTSKPFTNEADPGSNADGSFNVDTVVNFEDDGFDEGDFSNDQIFPGLAGNADVWFSTEALLNLRLPAGYYRFGVNSDDGFQVNALPPAGVAGTPILLGQYDNGRSQADTYFDVLANVSGIYPVQLIYFQSTGRAELEFFSIPNVAETNSVLVNDTNNPNAVISYRSVKSTVSGAAPTITSIVRNGSNVIITWAGGVPPYQLQSEAALNNSWSNSGSATTNNTAAVSIQPGNAFFRILSH